MSDFLVEHQQERVQSSINSLENMSPKLVHVKQLEKFNRMNEGQGYRLYDIPGRNDDLSNFEMKYIAFWKALTSRMIVITTTVKEMTTVFRLLDAIHLRYDIIVNKFDLVKPEERATFQAQIQQEIRNCNLQGVDHLWFVSAENPNQFPDWNKMFDYLQRV